MAFVTVDPDAIEIADNQLATLVGEITNHRRQHQWRADRTREGLGDLRRKSFDGLVSWAIQRFWDGLPLGGLAGEYRAALGVEQDIRRQVEQLFATLAQQHSGKLHDRIQELGNPVLVDIDTVAGALGDLASWLEFGNMWAIIERPWAIEELLDRAWNHFGGAEERITATRATLDRLRQRTLVLVEELRQPLSDTNSNIVSAAGNAVSLIKFLAIPEDLHYGIFEVIGALLSYEADPHHSLHFLAAHLIGSGMEWAVGLIPGVGPAEVAVAAVGLVSQLEAWSFDAAGRLQGGRWGSKLAQVGGDWQKTAGDANAMDATFTDAGAAVLDVPNNVKAVVLLPGPPGLAPTAVLAYDEVTGQDTAAFNGDVVKMGQEGLHFLKLPLDLGRSVWNTNVIEKGDTAHNIVKSLPNGVRQPVDNAVYDMTSHLMIGG